MEIWFIWLQEISIGWNVKIKLEKGKYTGRVLAVGISYDKETKEHACKVEEL